MTPGGDFVLVRTPQGVPVLEVKLGTGAHATTVSGSTWPLSELGTQLQDALCDWGFLAHPYDQALEQHVTFDTADGGATLVVHVPVPVTREHKIVLADIARDWLASVELSVIDVWVVSA